MYPFKFCRCKLTPAVYIQSPGKGSRPPETENLGQRALVMRVMSLYRSKQHVYCFKCSVITTIPDLLLEFMETALNFAINHWIYINIAFTITITEDILVIPFLLFALLKPFLVLDWREVCCQSICLKSFCLKLCHIIRLWHCITAIKQKNRKIKSINMCKKKGSKRNDDSVSVEELDWSAESQVLIPAEHLWCDF